MTDNELKLLKYIISVNHFNGDKLDLTKSWEEQNLESDICFYSIVELKEYSKLLGLSEEGARGVLGNLTKKGFCSTMQDQDDKKLFWLHIYKEQFERIKNEIK